MEDLEEINQRKKAHDMRSYKRTSMQKEMVLEKLKDRGCRITKQRRMLLDIILEKQCTCCKDIYYSAKSKDSKIGCATVYRMVSTLEDIGAISRKNLYEVTCPKNISMDHMCQVILDDNTTYNLSADIWNKVIRSGLIACGYVKDQEIMAVTIRECNCH